MGIRNDISEWDRTSNPVLLGHRGQRWEGVGEWAGGSDCE